MSSIIISSILPLQEHELKGINPDIVFEAVIQDVNPLTLLHKPQVCQWVEKHAFLKLRVLRVDTTNYAAAIFRHRIWAHVLATASYEPGSQIDAEKARRSLE